MPGTWEKIDPALCISNDDNFKRLFLSDVSWKKEEQPYDEYRQKQYKFLNPTDIDFVAYGKRIPNYKDL